MTTIYIAECYLVLREGLRYLIEVDPTFKVVGDCGDCAGAIAGVRKLRPDVLLLDLDIPGRGPEEVVSEVHRLAPSTQVLILTGRPPDVLGVRLLQAGACGYLGKDSSGERLRQAIHRVASGGKVIPEALAEQLLLALNRAAGVAPVQSLSPRELRVLSLLGHGRTIGDIARELALSVKTVSTYRARLAAKLGVKSTNELIAYALREGFGREGAPAFAPSKAGKR